MRLKEADDPARFKSGEGRVERGHVGASRGMCFVVGIDPRDNGGRRARRQEDKVAAAALTGSPPVLMEDWVPSVVAE